MENKHQGYNVISKLQTENGIVTKDESLLKETSDFYKKKLYRSSNMNSEEVKAYLNNIEAPTHKEAEEYIPYVKSTSQ